VWQPLTTDEKGVANYGRHSSAYEGKLCSVSRMDMASHCEFSRPSLPCSGRVAPIGMPPHRTYPTKR